MPDIDTSRPQSCGCGEASYADCACNPKPLPWGSGQATFPNSAQSPSRVPSPVDTSPAALRALADAVYLVEQDGSRTVTTVNTVPAIAAADALRALAAEKEAAVVAFDAASRDAHLEIIREKDATIDALRASLAAYERDRDTLRAELSETYTDERGTVWTRPTAWAYAAVCEARTKWQDRAEKAEAERDALITALDRLLYPKPASGTRVYTLPDGQRECLTAKQYDEACARHLLQTLATQDLLAMPPGVETALAAPDQPEDPAHD